MTNFVDVLNEMKEHYQNNINTGMVIPYYPNFIEDSLSLGEAENNYLSSDVNNSNKLADNSAEHEVTAFKKQGKDWASDSTLTVAEKLKTSSKKFKENIDSSTAQSDFEKEVDRIGNEAKKNACETIDIITTKAKQIGKLFPGKRKFIIDSLHMIGELITKWVKLILDYISKLIDNIIEWIKSVFDFIATTFNSIKQWVDHWFETK